MAFVPDSHTRARDAKNPRLVRVHSEPMWWRPDGRNWSAIDDDHEIVQLGNGGYRINLFGHEHIQLLPVTDLRGKIVKDFKRARHFGPTLDLGAIPDDVAYRVVTTSGVKFSANPLGWYVEIDGIQIGLWLDDWKPFAPTVAVNRRDIMLDMRAEKAKQRDLPRDQQRVNLDPITVNASLTDCIRMRQRQTTWAAARGDASTNAWLLDPSKGETGHLALLGWAAVQYQPDGKFYMERAGIRLNGVTGPIASGKFCAVKLSDPEGVMASSRAGQATFDTAGAPDVYTLHEPANYGHAFSMIGNTLWGTFVEDATVDPDEGFSVALDPTHWAYPTLDVTCIHPFDYTDAAPVASPFYYHCLIEKPGSGTAPYVEYTEVSAGLVTRRIARTPCENPWITW